MEPNSQPLIQSGEQHATSPSPQHQSPTTYSSEPTTSSSPSSGKLLQTILMMNIRGLLPQNNPTKIKWLFDIAKIKNSPVINLTETHLCKEILDNELIENDWCIQRCDRSKRKGGGVATLFRNNILINSDNILSYSNSYCNVLGLIFSDNSIANITVYRPPGCNNDSFMNCLNDLDKWLSELTKKQREC